MKLTVFVPAHNEEENIVDVINKIEEAIDFDFDLLIVNDHSSDRTKELVLGLMKKYKNLSLIENLDAGCFGNAIKTGFLNAKTDVVVPVMGDLCDDLSTIKVMFDKIVSGYDVVCAARYTSGGARLGGSRIKAFFSSFVGLSLNFLLGLPTHDIPNAFKMYRKKVIDAVTIKSKGFEVSMETALKAYFLGYKITEVPTVWKEREKGKSSFSMTKLLPSYLKWYLWAICRSFFPRSK
ncbi:MAG: glycosyltransferase [Candidatus Omnitrophica bacterium]|nr:glycosyltransferase [Candidatus Omnitrophota bacterium]